MNNFDSLPIEEAVRGASKQREKMFKKAFQYINHRIKKMADGGGVKVEIMWHEIIRNAGESFDQEAFRAVSKYYQKVGGYKVDLYIVDGLYYVSNIKLMWDINLPRSNNDNPKSSLKERISNIHVDTVVLSVLLFISIVLNIILL